MTTALTDIHLRDPFLLTVPEEAAFYLFGTTDPDSAAGPGVGFDFYRSADLVSWDGPLPAFRPPHEFWADRNFWAPEVHPYRGRWYLFATFTSAAARGTQILIANRPEGPFAPWSDGPVTPAEWECLDGTLHIDDAGNPWIVYCHEWTQIIDGKIVAQRLNADLTRAVSDPVVLFTASTASWVRPIPQVPLLIPPDLLPPDAPAYVTDGPFLYRTGSGVLLMLWSSFGEDGYAVGVARSATGSVEGPWEHDPAPLFRRDGGHAMMARTLDGNLLLALHRPNEPPHERAHLFPVVESGAELRLP